MRFPLLAATLAGALLAAPVLTRAAIGNPNPGEITFNDTDADPAAKFINKAECSDRPGTHAVSLNWTVTGTAQPNITYALYAYNAQPPSGQPCPTNSGWGGVTSNSAVAVGEVSNKSQLTIIAQDFDPALMVSALNPSPCSITVDTQIFLCMSARSGGSEFSQARGIITLSTKTPDATPTLDTPIMPGDRALNPSWNDNGSTNTAHYQVQAISVANGSVLPPASAFDPNGGYTGFDSRDTNRHFSAFVTARNARVGGLVNGLTYAVAVTGYTEAYTASDPSNIGTGAPQVVLDFWDIYKNDGGRESGGCSSGVAGPIGLLALAGALALARRRR